MKKKFFNYKSLDDIRADVSKLGVDISFEENLEAIKNPVKVGSRVAGNSLAIHPMEGCDGTLDGKPDELTYRRWLRFGVGGAKMIWGEATAVVPEGRANTRQLLMNDKNLKEFEKLLKLTRSVHQEVYGTDEDLLVGLQLTHSGRYSFQKPMIAYHHPVVDSLTFADKEKKDRINNEYPLVSDEYLEQLEDAYVAAAKNAIKVGFDFIDVKQCHAYLLRELLGARNRPGKYGGSFENRTRFVRNTLQKINEEVGDQIILASRINAFDGIPFTKNMETGIGIPMPYEIPYEYGFGIDKKNPTEEDLTEVFELMKILVENKVKILNVTIGSPYCNMHIGRPFDFPPIDGYYSPEHPLLGVERHFRITAAIKKNFPQMVVVGTGYSWLQKYLINAAEANLRNNKVSIVGLGRCAIAYPSFANDAITEGELKSTRTCYTISYCTALMRSKDNELGQYPTGCVPRDPLYAPIFKESLKKIKDNKAGN